MAKGILIRATAVAAAALFAGDRHTEFQVDFAAMYAIVVLLAGRFLRARGVMLVAGGNAPVRDAST